MAKIDQKIATMQDALKTLHEAIMLHDEFQLIISSDHVSRDEIMAMASRDSMIQRFEYCTDLFWKVLKVYLEDIEKITLSVNSPAGIIRACVEAKIITEGQGQDCIQMIKNRNLTSHMYHQEIAYDIAKQVPSYYKLIYDIIEFIK